MGEELFPKGLRHSAHPAEGLHGHRGTVRHHRAGPRRTCGRCPTRTCRRCAPRKRRNAEIVIDEQSDTLPASLSEALVAFCLVGGVRTLRPGFAAASHTMLVHVSQRIADQQRITAAPSATQLVLVREAAHQGQRLGGGIRAGVGSHQERELTRRLMTAASLAQRSRLCTGSSSWN